MGMGVGRLHNAMRHDYYNPLLVALGVCCLGLASELPLS